MRLLFEERLRHELAACVRASAQYARPVLGAYLALTLAFAVYAATNLGINADNKTLLDPDLPFQKAAAEFKKHFPSQDDTLFIVIDARTADMAREAARALGGRLERYPERFSDIFMPGAEQFFEERGLLYRSIEEVYDLVDHLAQLQPLIGELTRNPSIANLASFIEQGLEHERVENTTGEQWSTVLDRIGQATVQVYRSDPVAVSWEDVMLRGSALDPGTRQVIIAEPILEFGKPLAAADALATIRSEARDLGFTPERGVVVRITGNPALAYDEVLNMAWDVGVSSFYSMILVAVLLYLALRSMRLVAAAAITLVTGIVWTAAFATVSIGQLNLVSMSFAVLFIGLGVDFAIHVGMHWVDGVRAGARPGEAMEQATDRIGTSLALCTVSTAIGFFSFVPTEYRGVAELGLIAGAGMFIIFTLTLTLFPALVAILIDDRRAAGVREAMHLRVTPSRVVARHKHGIVAIAAIAAVTAVVLLPRTRFDCNVITMRDPRTESVQAFNDLLERSRTSPWSVDLLTRDVASAERVAKRMRELDVVADTVTLANYVPGDQEEKIEALAEAAILLDVPPSPETENVEPPVEAQVAALRKLHDLLAADWIARSASPLARSAEQLREHLGAFLARVEREGDAPRALADLQQLLLGNVGPQIERLQKALEPEPITIESLPDDLRRRMLAPDGHARVQVFPEEDLSDTDALIRFVDAVKTVDPEATGVAVNVLAFGRATAHSLRVALILALISITLLLLVLWRRVGETLLALAPLVVGALVTGGSMVVLGMPFNFANVIVLPLLIGIGVDSGIHIVSSSRERALTDDTSIDATTARAVFFSAVTTIGSFGSLALSHHRGIASMGSLLVVGMLIMLACNLILLPALLAMRQHSRSRGTVE